MDVDISESYGVANTGQGSVRSYAGELEVIVKDATTGVEVSRQRNKNIIKVFAKEILAHRLPYFKVWDPNANTGAGGWVAHSLDLDEFSPKYICLGASFDVDGLPLDAADTRFYTLDQVTGAYIPKSLEVGATNDGGLINAVPIAEPTRPLKRIERIYFEPSYQPAGVPLLQSDTRAMNNVVVLETTLQKDEYNGFGTSVADFFTITEVALVAGKELGAVGDCECDPRLLFLEGDSGGVSLLCGTTGTSTVTLDGSVTGGDLNLIKEGDQIKIVAAHGGKLAPVLGQISPYYLVLSKVNGGRDMVLDRTPMDSSNTPLTGSVGVFRDGFKMFSHRLLVSPVKKTSDYLIVLRWRIMLN